MNHTCVELDSGEIKCTGDFWGTSTPTTIAGLSGPIDNFCSGGLYHQCAIKNGELFCWGINQAGQLGTGNTTDSKTVAQKVTFLSGTPIGVACGNSFTCASLNTGEVQCWGVNDIGELGNGTTGSTSLTPVYVAGVSTATSKIASGLHTCVVLSDGTMKCWGFNRMGQVGMGSLSESVAVPTTVIGISGL
jgi:alpha-tubulin suppressor-like RCC1 family protein